MTHEQAYHSLGVVIGVGLIFCIADWHLGLTVIVAAIVMIFIVVFDEYAAEIRDNVARWRKKLADDCDRQNEQYLRGDPHGFYGDNLPPPL